MYCIERCVQVKEHKSCTILIFHGEKNLVLNSEKSRFRIMVGLVCLLEAVVKVKLPDMSFNLRGHCLFSDLGQEVEVGYWAVVFEGALVKCSFLKERRDNSLLKPVRENTFTEGKVYVVGDKG